MHAFIKTATEIANEGKFDGFDGLISNAELNKFFSEDRKSLSVMDSKQPVGPPVDADAGAAARAGDAVRTFRLGRAARSRARCRGPVARLQRPRPHLDLYFAPRSVRRRGDVCGLARRAGDAERSLCVHGASTPAAARVGSWRFWKSARRCASSKSATSSTRPALQRTPLATEAQYLLARYVFETLGYRRYEWKCDALNARLAPRRFALWLRLRGHIPPAHDRQGPQSRHRVVLHARSRVAGAQAQLRALAGAGEFR